MRKKLLIIVTLILVMMLGTAVVYGGPTFTGDAPADFTAPDTIVINDIGGIGDVGLPANAPLGTISGWDIAAIYLDYDPDTDIMYVGFDCGGPGGPAIICGDADGDGDPGATSTWLNANAGVDEVDLSGSESMALLIDTDNDGDANVTIGVNDAQNISSFAAYNRQAFCTGFSAPNLSLCWGAALPNIVNLFANPSASAPDLEFSIADFSTLPGFTYVPGQAYSFGLSAFAGSASDDGIGEDLVPGVPTTVNIPLSVMDMGDLTETLYPTQFSSDGARHLMSSNLRLGQCVDDDTNGQPNATATGDDTAPANSITTGTCSTPDQDEDGVTREPGLNGASNNGGWTNGTVVSGEGGRLDITITGGSGVPQVFIDFGDGAGGLSGTLTPVTLLDNTGANLLATPTTPLAAGTYQAYFDIPGGSFAASNQPVAVRVRLNSAGGLTATGLAPDGEVEDYIYGFGPTAVTLADTQVSPLSGNNSALPLLAVVLFGLTGMAIFAARRQTQ